MKDGAVEIYLNHPVVIVGATSNVDTSLTLGDLVVVASRSHILISTRAQIAPVTVSFWSSVAVRVGKVVYDGPLEFPDSYVCVADVEGSVRYTKRIGGSGVHHVLVSVDDPGAASRIHVVFDGVWIEGHLSEASTGLLAGSVAPTGPEALEPPDELEFVLAEHDAPQWRLAAAIRLISLRPREKSTLFLYDIRTLTEWLRWLGPSVSLARAQSCARLVRERLEIVGGPVSSSLSAEIAAQVLDCLEYPELEIDGEGS
jgi:hypothetical protein